MPIDESLPTGPERAPPSFRPAPVLTVAVAGHRRLDATGREADRIGAAAADLFASLAREAAAAAERDAAFFGGGPARLRAVSRFAGEADLAIMEAAGKAGCELRAILPWRRDPGAAAPELARLLAQAPQPLDLDGEPGDERLMAEAGQALLERADLLVVFWRGAANASPAGTAALVQHAVRRRMPVLLLPVGEGGVSVIDDPENHLLPPLATELPRVPLAGNPDRVVARVFSPPVGEAERRALQDCLDEPLSPRSRRPEYRVLLAIAARRAPGKPALPAGEEWARARALAALVSEEAALAVSRTERLQARMEELAAFYGERARSGVVLRYGMPAVGGVFIALLAVLLPQYGLAWLGVQAVVMTLLVSESTWGSRRRWSERWLDYRSLAERLRCDRFLEPCGIGSRRIEEETGAEDPAWMRWCHRRLVASAWTGGTVSAEIVAAALRHLVEVEIPGQIRYHEGATLRYRSLGRRLGLIATFSATGMLAASLVLLALPAGSSWLTVAVNLLMSLLIVLPSLFLAARGLRAEGGYELASARSAEAAAALRRLAGLAETAPAGYGPLVRASLAAARAMILDTVDWRVGLQRSRTPYRGEPQKPREAGTERDAPSALRAAEGARASVEGQAALSSP
ncbi:hypothetical protein [Enterovirga sp.]|uniref:hypothetical protein n=1 Tax=Enterovirga sp. TaxID=2026350 RepID=UPI002BE45A28|nr:hypothetical protein [Enterovirga sp.]HMO28550.1 hypothetical protein [Enterovirga sp.]